MHHDCSLINLKGIFFIEKSQSVNDNKFKVKHKFFLHRPAILCVQWHKNKQTSTINFNNNMNEKEHTLQFHKYSQMRTYCIMLSVNHATVKSKVFKNSYLLND